MSLSVSVHALRAPIALLLALVLLMATLLVAPNPAAAQGPPESVRFATFNASLNRASAGLALDDLLEPYDATEPDAALERRRFQAATVAEIIQRVRPEVLLINEFDYIAGPVTGNDLTEAFQDNYLGVSQNGQETIHYDYVFVAPSNTGIHSGFDLNNNDVTDNSPGDFAYGDDALGFGEFPGKFGMAVFSQHPIDYAAARTFQNFKWAAMPGALLPTYPDTWPVAELRGEPWYTDAELAVLPLSSKSHWDVPIDIGGSRVHFLVSHPTPPVFDGAEDRNGRRNSDEIRLWADYVTPGAGGYIYDDNDVFGGLKPGEKFVIAGDQNADPLDGDSFKAVGFEGAIQQLLNNPRINTTVTPESLGAPQQAALQGGINATHLSDPRFDTADFADGAPGNLRADYVLPSRNLRIVGSGVFWPLASDPLFRLVGVFNSAFFGGFPSSDHRSVWVDVMVPGSARAR